MRILTLSVAVAAVMVVFELAAVRFGADSRGRLDDSARMHSDGGPF